MVIVRSCFLLLFSIVCTVFGSLFAFFPVKLCIFVLTCGDFVLQLLCLVVLNLGHHTIHVCIVVLLSPANWKNRTAEATNSDDTTAAA